MDRGWYSIDEVATFLGKKRSTIQKWLQTGKMQASLFMIHGNRVQRVVKAEELDRMYREEAVPNLNARPDSRAQWLWDHHKWKGPKRGP